YERQMPICPVVLSGGAVVSATSIDGALLLDPEGTCHGVGVILDGASYFGGTASRGARFNSALRYVCHGEQVRRLAVVFSEDGHVDLLPRLRPRFRVADLAAELEYLMSSIEGGEVALDVRRRCFELVYNYSEYVFIILSGALRLDEDAQREVVRKLWVASGEFGRSGPMEDVFDPHFSDMIRDSE
ncbi:diadenylate cyclase, partial [Myxococcus vastator]|uniref:diadenylate cyclase n=1 Tax=Myxococcus vastator TaxID=2709664 RepID=UPI001968258C